MSRGRVCVWGGELLLLRGAAARVPPPLAGDGPTLVLAHPSPPPPPTCPPRAPAAAFNQFYGECQVVGSGPAEESRLLLCEATARVMRACFQLLGIRVLYRI